MVSIKVYLRRIVASVRLYLFNRLPEMGGHMNLPPAGTNWRNPDNEKTARLWRIRFATALALER